MALWQDKCNRLDFAYRGYQYPVPPSWKYAVRLEDQIQWLLQAILKTADDAMSEDDLMDLRNEVYDFIDRVATRLEGEIKEAAEGKAFCFSPVDGFMRAVTVAMRQVYDAARPLALLYSELAAKGMPYAPLQARGKTYDAIIMDPPSYGRGPGGEVWKLEDNLFPFVKLCSQVLSDKPLFVIINSYNTGLAPSVLGYMLHLLVAEKYGGRVTGDELWLPVTETGLALPCGATGRWCSE